MRDTSGGQGFVQVTWVTCSLSVVPGTVLAPRRGCASLLKEPQALHHWQISGSCCRQREASLISHSAEQLLQGHGLATFLKLEDSCQTFYFCFCHFSLWADTAGAEVQHLCWLVVLWCPPVWDAHRPIPFPRPRWRGTFPVHPYGQSLLPSLAGQGCKGHFGEGKMKVFLPELLSSACLSSAVVEGNRFSVIGPGGLTVFSVGSKPHLT